MGVVCAAPTGGSAGVLPGVLVTLAERDRVVDPGRGSRPRPARRRAVGVIVAERATFAAEIAGCQVEIGAAGAMAAAAVVEPAGGTAGQACDAAAIAFQNTMGSVCDLVQGIVRDPLPHAQRRCRLERLCLRRPDPGRLREPRPLDETIDAVLAVGRHAALGAALHRPGRTGHRPERPEPPASIVIVAPKRPTPLETAMTRIRFALLLALLLSITACAAPPRRETAPVTLDMIYETAGFRGERFGPARWLADGSGYTTLEASEGEAGGRDIVRYDPETGAREVLVAAEKLVPEGREDRSPSPTTPGPTTGAACSSSRTPSASGAEHPRRLLGARPRQPASCASSAATPSRRR